MLHMACQNGYTAVVEVLMKGEVAVDPLDDVRWCAI